MNNKNISKNKVQQILELRLNVDTIKYTGRVTPSCRVGSSFLSLCNAKELYISFMNRIYSSSSKQSEKE